MFLVFLLEPFTTTLLFARRTGDVNGNLQKYQEMAVEIYKNTLFAAVS